MSRKALLSVLVGIVAAVAVAAGILMPPRAVPRPKLGVDYTPYYRQGTSPGTPIPVEQIDRDIEMIAPYFTAVRGYGSASNLSVFYERAHAAGLETYATAWLDGGPGDETELMLLEDQIAKGNVTYAIVGSEALHRGDLTAQELMVYINRVRSAADQSLGEGKVVVTTADTVDALVANRKELASLERVGCHIHPVWANRTPEQSLDFVREELARVEEAFGVPVDILETGYPSPGPEDSYSQQEVGLFLRKLADWSRERNVACFLLGARDEPWKVDDSGLEFEGRWGLYLDDTTLKSGNELIFSQQPLTAEAEAAVQLPMLLQRLEALEEGGGNGYGSRYQELLERVEELEAQVEKLEERVGILEGIQPEEPWNWEEALQVTETPAYGVPGSALLKGTLDTPGEGYYLMIYVEVKGELYVKPTLAQPLTYPDPQNGIYICETNTGGNDIYATGFRIEVYDPKGVLQYTRDIVREPS